jgi:pimeloyl-ACP methyl ester carboxylesterase
MFARLAAVIVLAWGLHAGPASAEPRWLSLPNARPLPKLSAEGRVQRGDARIWYGVAGQGAPVVILHGGVASSDFMGGEAQALLASRRQVILVDSRGHGRSTLGHAPLTYEGMAEDVVAVLDAVHVDRAAVVGWSDGAIIGLVLAMKHPERTSAVYAFGANMDLSGFDPRRGSLGIKAKAGLAMRFNYLKISPTPLAYGRLEKAVTTLQATQPNYTRADLRRIQGPRIAIVDADHEEFIPRAHTEYLARTIPGAELIILPGVSHFAPIQDPDGFSRSAIDFLNR